MSAPDTPKLTKITKRRNESTMKILKLAEEEEFDEVIIVGFNGPNFRVMVSATLSRMQQIGALEFVKKDIMGNE